MPRITVVFSLLYIALGLAGFFLTGGVHKTALIPAIIGVVSAVAFRIDSALAGFGPSAGRLQAVLAQVSRSQQRR